MGRAPAGGEPSPGKSVRGDPQARWAPRALLCRGQALSSSVGPALLWGVLSAGF